MVRIEATNRSAAAQGTPRRETAEARPTETGRALVVQQASRTSDSERARTRGDARPAAGFVAHLIVSTDPSLAPSRIERAQRACRIYTASARQVA